MTTNLSFPHFDCYKVAPVSFSSPCACPLRLSSCKPLPLPPSSLKFNRLHFLFLHGQKGLLRINKRTGLARRHIVAVAHAEPDRIDGKEPQQVLWLNSVIVRLVICCSISLLVYGCVLFACLLFLPKWWILGKFLLFWF